MGSNGNNWIDRKKRKKRRTTAALDDETGGWMAGELLGKWLSWWRPVRGGLTEWGLANGLLLTGGWFWARVRGGYLLYRGRGGRGQIDWRQPAGAAGFDAREIHEFPWKPRGPAGSYRYGVTAIGCAGMEAAPTAEAVGCGVDDNGVLIGGLPGEVERLWAEPAAQGRVLLRWCYSAQYEAARPSEFRIYDDAGTGQIDYSHSVGSTAWDLRRQVYSWLSGTYEPGVRMRFGVRARNAAGPAAGAEVEVVVGGNGPTRPGLMLVEESHGD